MIKALAVALLSGVLGLGLGFVQASLSNQSSEERFSTSRPPLKVRSKQSTKEEFLDQTKSYGKPKVELVDDTTEYDFGSMMHGSEMSHAFKFRNSGDGPLLLEMGDSSCKCTVGDLEKTVLQPGEETDVTLTWTAFSMTRDFGQHAFIKTNDVDNLEIKLVVKGQITESVTIVPKTLELNNISDSEVTERKLMVYVYDDDITQLQQLSWTDDETDRLIELSAEEVPLADVVDPRHKNAQRAFELTFRVKPGFPIGKLGSRIQFRTNRGDDIGTLEVPVSGRATGSLDLAGGPSFDKKRMLVKLGNVKQSEGAEVSLVLFVMGDNRETVVPEVQSIDPQESLEVEIGEPTKTDSRVRFPVRFRVPKGAPEVYLPARAPGTFGQVTLRTRGGLDRELRINVQMKVSR